MDKAKNRTDKSSHKSLLLANQYANVIEDATTNFIQGFDLYKLRSEKYLSIT